MRSLLSQWFLHDVYYVVLWTLHRAESTVWFTFGCDLKSMLQTADDVDFTISMCGKGLY